MARLNSGRIVGRVRCVGNRLARTVEEPSPAGDGATAAMRTALASGFRRSLARHRGRTIAALAIVAIVAPIGCAPASASSTRSGPTADATIAGLTARAVAAPESSDLTADLAAFGPATAGRDLSLDAEAAAVAAEAAAANAGLQPSIQYDEAVRHADDAIAFTPGERVTVGFQPRAGDTWPVGGAQPAALPAGRLDGKTMRAQGPDLSVDLPSGGPAPVDATSTSFHDTAMGPTGPAVEPDARVSPSGLRREIFGFLPYWQVNSSSLRLDYAKISTIAYFGVGADGNGNLQKRNSDGSTTVGWSGWTSSKMSSIISTAHANRTRVVLTVQSFAWSTSGLNRQRQLLGSSAASPEPRPPDRRRRPRPGRRRGQPRLRAARLDLRRRVHRPRPDDPLGAEQGPQRLPDHVRHDSARSGTTRSRRPPPRAAPTRSSSWATTTARRPRARSARSRR